MGVAERLRELEAEDDNEAPDVLGRFNQRVLVQAVLHPDTRKYVEPYMPSICPSMFTTESPEQICFMAIKEFYSKYNSFASPDKTADIVDDIKRSISIDSPAFEGALKLLRAPLAVEDLAPMRADLAEWVKRSLWVKVLSEGPLLVSRGDYGALNRLIADAEAGVVVEPERVIDLFSRPGDFLQPDAVRHLKLGVPGLYRSLGTGGPQPGEVLCYLGRTGMGKSIYLGQDAVGSAVAGQNTLLITLEISLENMARRCASNLTGVDTKELLDQSETVQRRCLKQWEALERRDTLKIVSMLPHTHSVNHIRSTVRRLQQECGWTPEVIVIDYLDKLVPRAKSSQQSEYERQKEVSDDLVYLAKEQDVLVVTGTQANREGVKSEANVGLQHMAESYGKAMGLDYIVSLNQTMEERHDVDGPLMRLNVIKNREGECRTVLVRVNYATKKTIEVEADGE